MNIQKSFAALSQRGKNDWWRYLLAILLLLFFWVGVGSLSNLVAVGNLQNFLVDYLKLMWSFLTGLVGLVLAVQWIHRRSSLTLITPREHIDWRRIAQGAGLCFLLILVTLVLPPWSYRLNWNPSQFFLFLPFALILTPLQTTMEEMVFRGYILQASWRINRHPLFLIGFNSLLFMLAHFANPEMGVNFFLGALFYLLTGVFLSWITLWDNKLELALGVHAATNLFAFLGVTYPHAAVPTPALFISSSIDPLSTLASEVVVSILFILILFRPFSRFIRGHARK